MAWVMAVSEEGDVTGGVGGAVLEGVRVVAIGMRWDAMGVGVRALAAAGADVVAYPIGPGEMFGDDVITEDDVERFEVPLPAGSGTVEIVEGLDGRQVGDALADDGIDGLLADACRRLGHVDVVYLSAWYGFRAFEIVPSVLGLLAERDGQLIVTETPADDQQLRWSTRWLAQAEVDVDLVVLTEPGTAPRTRVASRSASGAAAVLVDAGWLGPYALADADAWAAEQRREGDALAGRLWRDIGIEHVDSGRIVVLDGTVELTDELVEQLAGTEDEARPPWFGEPSPFVRFGTGGDWPVGVTVAEVDDEVVAVRFEVDDEAGFGSGTRYRQIAALQLAAPGQLRISDPAYLDRSPGRRIDVRPGPWVVEAMTSEEGRSIGVRCRHANPFDPDPFAGTGGVDRERAVHVLADSLDWDTGSPGASVRSCVLDRSCRVAVVTLPDGTAVELVVAFAPTRPAAIEPAGEALRAVAEQLLWAQGDPDDADAVATRTIDDVRLVGGLIEADITAGPTVVVGVRRRIAATPMSGPDAFRDPDEVHGDLRTCPACGGTVWPISYGMPTGEAFEHAGEDQVIYGGCLKDDRRRGVCTTCGWEDVLVL